MNDPEDEEPWRVHYFVEDEDDAIYEQAEHWCCVYLFEDEVGPQGEDCPV